ncbi:MAG: ABC transporter permease, partial [Acidobacteriaceae bacterium]|nr:ABC transporter permease [Acidobacteriaceae bacterium]
MGSFWQDVHYAIRSLRKRPVFTIVAIASLALGIAVNATVFSWVQRILLRPLPGVRNVGELVSIKTLAPNGDLLDSSYLDFRDFRDQSKTLAGAIAFKQRPLYLGDVPNIQRVWSEMVSGNFFEVLGVKPILGRTFSRKEQEAGPGGAPVAVINETLWRRRFQARKDILGQTIKLNREAFTIIGVTPANFQGTIDGLNFDLWVPLTMQAQLTGSWDWLSNRDSRPLALMGRLRPGVSLKEAQAEISTIAKRLELAYPQSNRRLGAAVLKLADSPDGIQRILGTLLRVLLVVGAAVLLIVCANVGNLLLARAVARQKEFGIRLSLGASRARLLQQLFTEALVLAAAGAGIGLLASAWMSRGIDVFLPPNDLPIANLGGPFQSAGFLFTTGLSLATAILCALAPAWQVLRREAVELTRESGRSLSAGIRSRTLRGALVISELALALIALIGTGLFIKSFQNARNANPGFDPDHILLAGLDLSQSRVSTEQSIVLLQRLQQHLESLPGVSNVSLCEDVPLGFAGGSWETLELNGYTPQPGESMKIWRNLISPGYFGTLDIPLVAGRDFSDRDTRASQPVAIVNQTFVRRYFGSGQAIGRKFHAWNEEITVVGVARDSKYRELAESPMPYFYLPLAQFYSPSRGIGVEVRTKGQPELFDQTLRGAIRSVDPNLAIVGTAPFVSYMSASYFAQKVGASLLTALGLVSLLLATLGLYGVMAYAMSQRIREIGIRVAVGARPAQILSLVIREGMQLCIIGVIAG